MTRTTSVTPWHYIRSALVVTITGGALAVCSDDRHTDQAPRAVRGARVSAGSYSVSYDAGAKEYRIGLLGLVAR
jgi:hypothetical protein